MGSQTGPPPPDRAQTMTSQSPMVNQMSSAAAMRRPSPMRQQSNGYPPPQVNGYYPNQRPNNRPLQAQPQPQSLPQPLNPNSRPYPQPQRIDSRQPIAPQYNRQPSNRGYPPSITDAYKPIPNRGYPPDPALIADPYRTRSMASMSTAPTLNASTSSYTQAAANSFRQQPYQAVGSRTTAQGRVVPERHDERTMSMSSFSMDRDHSQTMSGRIIPNRRRQSGPEGDLSTHDNSQSDEIPFDPRATSPQETLPPSRTMSMASTIVPPTERSDSLRHHPSLQHQSSSNSAIISAQSRAPLVTQPCCREWPTSSEKESLLVIERRMICLTNSPSVEVKLWT